MRVLVFFYDSYDINTGVFYNLEEALAEGFARVRGSKIIPFDKCSIIYWCDDNWDLDDADGYIEQITGQKFKNASLSEL